MTDGISESYRALRFAAEAEARGRQSRETVVITVGAATCGRSAGALEVIENIEKALNDNSLTARIDIVGCAGHCYAEPLVVIAVPGQPAIMYSQITPDLAPLLIRNYLAGGDMCLEWALGAAEENDLIPPVTMSPRFAGETRRLLRRCGAIDPLNINEYIAADGYSGLSYALSGAPEAAIENIKRSGLRGLGGGGFPAGEKIELVRAAPEGMKYVICNADEGDPGAFMDRTLIESDPQSVLEGMLIAGYAAGASEGYIYIRNEYPLAAKTIGKAARQAAELGLIGQNILGSGFDFEIKIAQGAGAFVCGEETALIRSLEGKRGTPRPRPPYPAESGLHGKPTLVNNVKTFAYLTWIAANGPGEFASIGTERSKGTAVFALAGKVRSPGLVEVPFGATLREVVFEIGGGIPPVAKPSQAAGEIPVVIKRRFKAVQIGGPSGGCLPEEALDTPVDFDSLRDAGAIMGSGGMVVMDEDNCMVQAARYFLEFTQKESCGKCTFCRIGTKQMLDILNRIIGGAGRMKDLDNLSELAERVGQGSLCNLGRTAPNPVLTTLRYFRYEYEAHILEKRCPALECEKLTAYYISLERCQRACDACVGSCPTEAIYTRSDRLKAIDQEKCIKCHSCIDACPANYDAVQRVSPILALPEIKPDKTGGK
ncbi:MAG: NADH-ubiquinone oxidoreductase-F iron-sulfur binding region domain-containing protein [bacterium]